MFKSFIEYIYIYVNIFNWEINVNIKVSDFSTQHLIKPLSRMNNFIMIYMYNV